MVTNTKVDNMNHEFNFFFSLENSLKYYATLSVMPHICAVQTRDKNMTIFQSILGAASWLYLSSKKVQ